MRLLSIISTSHDQRTRNMPYHSSTTLCAVLAFMFFSHQAAAQSFYTMGSDRDMLVTVGIGTASYYGELNNPNDHLDTKPTFDVGLTVFPIPAFFNNRLAVRQELAYFRLHGTDAEANNSRVIRNLSFFSDNLELSTSINLHLLPVHQHFIRNNVFNIYGVLGIGLLYSNPRTIYQGSSVALQPLHTEGVNYSKFHMVIPMGFGIKLLQNNTINLAIEGTYRKTFTDYLDDASSNRYPDPATLSSDLARALADRRGEYYAQKGEAFTPKGDGTRGNPEFNDSYFLFTLKVSYYLPMRLKDMNKKLMIIRKKKGAAKSSIR